MIKKFLILVLFSLPIYAQQEQNGNKDNQNVELPEFVITGVERVNLPVVTKPKADLVHMLGESFFKPEIPTQELQIAELTNPIKKDIKLFDSHNNTNGNLILGGGFHTLPLGNFYYGKSFEHSLISASIWGIKEFPDTNFSAKNNSGISLNTSFFVSDSSGFLPGAKFSFNGLYNQDFYKFYAAKNPSLKRNIRNGELSFGVQDLLNNNFKFGINASENIIYLKEDGLTENNFGLGGFIETFYKDISFNTRLKYINQFLSDDLNSNRRGYVEGAIIMGIKTPEMLKLKFGFNFANSIKDKFFLPYAYMGYKINNFVSAFAEYNPHAEFITVSDLLKSNRYYNGAPFNFVQENQGGLTFALKYEYYTYYEINGGLKYDMYNNYLYFVDNDKNGLFETGSVKARNFGAFINLLFHLGPYGSLYSGLTLTNFQDLNGNQIPYISPININLNYSYDFDFGLKFESNLDFHSGRYTDLPNTKKINEFADLSLKFGYEISKNFNIFFSLMNILDHKNYEWTGYNSGDNLKYYRAKPFDMIMGINYIW